MCYGGLISYVGEIAHAGEIAHVGEIALAETDYDLKKREFADFVISLERGPVHLVEAGTKCAAYDQT